MRAVAYPALIGAVVVLAVLDASIVAVGTAAALAGLALPPLSSTVRIVWPRIAPGGLRSSAYALEAALQEVFFVGGPLLAAGLAAVEPAAAVAAAGIASCVGTSATARLPPVRATPAVPRDRRGPARRSRFSGVRTVVLYAAAIGVGFGAVELAMPAFAEEYGARELGGIALACFSAGSLVGGLAAGMRPPRSDLRRFVGGGVALAAALLGLQLAVSMPTLYVLSFLAGLPIAPTIGALYALIDRSAKAGTAAEAFAWFGTAVSIGIAIGSAAGGALVDERGVRWAFGFGAAVAFGGAFSRLGAPRHAARIASGGYRSRTGVYPAHGAPVAQGTERRTSNPRVGGSNPPGRTWNTCETSILSLLLGEFGARRSLG